MATTARSDGPQRIVLPGDPIPITYGKDNTPGKAAAIRLGPGISQSSGRTFATAAGSLHHHQQAADGTDQWWVLGNRRRYVAARGEPVVGIVQARLTDSYKVDIGAAYMANLPVLAFEGATKRNRVQLQIGTLVYARVAMANKDMEPEVECVNPTTGKADGFGELKDGFMIKCSLGYCRSTPVLSRLGAQIPLEAAVGMNGRVWINTDSIQNTIQVVQALRNAEHLNSAECLAMLENVFLQAS